MDMLTDQTLWQKLFYFIGTLAAFRYLLLSIKLKQFLDDIDHRDVVRFRQEQNKRFGG